MNNEKIETIIYICLIITCIIIIGNSMIKTKSESYDNKSPPIAGPNNMVLTDDSGNLTTIQFPTGVIIQWIPNTFLPFTIDKFGTGGVYPTSPPAGWAICDGANGTPDLRGKFLLGTNSNTTKNTNYIIQEVNKVGGSENITLRITNIPPHTHGRYNKNTQVGLMHLGEGTDFHFMGWPEIKETESAGGSNGSTRPFNILPPFYTVVYLMKL
jgi:hypothetical protein